VLSQRTGRQFARLDGLALAMVVATLAILPLGLGSVVRWSPDVIGTGFAIAVLSSVLPYSLELVALRHLRQQVFGILLSLEPAVAALAGFLVLGQLLEPDQLVGMGCVVVASILVLGARRRPPDPDPAEATAT
jgi:inner membrane transporter RhtA